MTFDVGLNDFFYYMAIILWGKLEYMVLVVGDERRFWRGQRSVSCFWKNDEKRFWKGQRSESSFWKDSELRDHFRLRNSVQCCTTWHLLVLVQRIRQPMIDTF